MSWKQRVEEEVGAAERHLGVMIENVDKKVPTVMDALEGTGERVDNQEKRIERLEDHGGLPALESDVDGGPMNDPTEYTGTRPEDSHPNAHRVSDAERGLMRDVV